MEETILFDFYISYRRGGLYSPLQKKFCIFKGALRFAFAEPSVNESVYEGMSFVFLDYEVLVSEPHSFDCVPSVTINLFPFIFFRWDGSDITLVGGIVRMNMYLHCFYLHFTSFERCKDSANRKQNKMNLFIFYFEVPPIFAFEQR